MKKKETKIIITIIIILVIILVGIVWYYFNSTNLGDSSGNSFFGNSSEEDEDFEIVSESTKIDVAYTDEELTDNYSDYNCKIDLNNLSIDGNGAKAQDSTITISKAGTYYFSGSNENANIVIDAGDDDIIILVFDNVKIKCKNTSVINGINAKEIIINLAKESNNTFSDSSEYTEFTDDDEPNSTVFSKTDLTVNGTGSLTINANYKDGIASKDNLKIINASLTVNANDDGIRGKDSVILRNSKIVVKSKGDSIKSTNEKEGKGWVYIDGGELELNSEGDGIDCETILNVNNDAKINIVTSGDVEDKTKTGGNDFMGKDGKMKYDGSIDLAETTTNSEEEENESSKGIKAGTEITINSANITISSTDDSIHSNGCIIINDIKAELSTGDDGITADTSLIINDGTINISKSYEGLEGQYIEINNGTVKIVSSDDGINVCGGSDNMFMGMEGDSNAQTDRVLLINGGNITVNADGDGLDSNGNIKITGGTILVAGPTNSGNGALDYNYNFELTGGKLIYYGASGMWQDASSSKINTVSYSVSNGKAGDELVLKDESGNEIASVTIEKSYQRISFANENIESGKKYILYINGEEMGSIEATNGVSTNATTNNDQRGNKRRKFLSS